MKLKILSLLAAALCGLATNAAGQGSSFYFTSSPNSIVGQGQEVTATSSNGFNFAAMLNPDNSITFTISSVSQTWNLSFAGPDGTPLTPGAYSFAQLWPNQAAGTPGLAFTSPTAVPDSIIGFFNVQNIQMGPGNTILAFDADFLQYDNGDFTRPNQGNIHFDGFSPVPEPGVAALAAVGLVALLFSQRVLRRRS